MKPRALWHSLAITLLPGALLSAAGRTTVPLDGSWQIGESVEAERRPTDWTRTVPVPGLVHLARPGFPLVDEFVSRELHNKNIERGTVPPSGRITSGHGISRQPRNYFWYRRLFHAPRKREAAIVRIAKAQFGVAVWLNGRKLGEHLGCFTASFYNATDAIHWEAGNELVVRVGAHPAVLPEGVNRGQDHEKNRWTPGIYDSVSLIAADNPVVEWVQVAPRIAEGIALARVRVKNYASRPVPLRAAAAVREAAGRRALAGRAAAPPATLPAGDEREVEIAVPVRSARLWSPEDPFLYALDASTGGDSHSVRFGMREFRLDGARGFALLNGRPYYLRGSNITLHRFFEDPESGDLPWNEAWVRKILAELPKRLHWNSFRFCIGPVPDLWLEIADEAGLLIQNEYFYWTERPTDIMYRTYDTGDLIRQLRDWMRDNWNHPSVVIWDANNETVNPVFAEKVIPAVRGPDLSGRPWDNGWNAPAGAGDPVEEHRYEFNSIARRPEPWMEAMAGFETRVRTEASSNRFPGHARILNEYGWIWLTRAGEPTPLTARVFEKLLGPAAEPAERLEMQAYLLAGVTEFWRATRAYAGILHFVYLTGSGPDAYTADHFRDVRAGELHAPFVEWMGDAFRPLGVYLNFWRATVPSASPQSFEVVLVNDDGAPSEGTLVAAYVTAGGPPASRAGRRYRVEPYGRVAIQVQLAAPAAKGPYVLEAAAHPRAGRPSVSRRRVLVE